MFSQLHKLLPIFLNCVFAKASGSIGDICVPVGNKSLPDYVSVDCADVLSSFDSIIENLLGGGTTFGGAVLSAIDGSSYSDATKQYASARVVTAPSLIIQAMNQADVRAAIVFAAHCDYKVTARSGGHSYIGSSSCDGSKSLCIQIDVGNINRINVTAPTDMKQVNVGPGVHLEDLYPVLIQNDIYLPAGECGDVSVGGHMQTGDGSLVSVSSPQSKVSSKLNDDIWYAVIGGAPGSFGVIVDITFNPVKETEHFAFSWEVNFLHSDTTKHCIRNMLQEFVNMVKDENLTKDMRWNLSFSFQGYKTWLYRRLNAYAFNAVQLDFTWVASGSSDRAQTFSEAKAIYERLYNSYTFQGSDSKCMTLDQHFDALDVPQLKTSFPSTYATASDAKSMSELHKEVTLLDWGSLELEKNGINFTTSYQQGPLYPNADDLLKVFDLIDDLTPTDPQTDKRLVLARIGVLPGPSNKIRNVAQPFQDDVIGVVFDVWSLDGADYSQHQRELQNVVISSIGGVNHRSFGAPYEEDSCLECGAWEKYYETRSTYNELRRIKGCVDPDNLFKF